MQNDVMFAEERKIKIVEYIQEHKKASVAELCSEYAVSSATIRNDLRELEETGSIIRTHGGALVKTKTGLELTTKQKRITNPGEKKKIAAAALDFVENGDTIIIDTGTTTIELARLLQKKENITVVTNDLSIASVLEDFSGIMVILMGGNLRKGFHCTVGAGGKTLLSGLTVDKAFMGANGFTFEKGATTPDLQHAETKKMMVAIAEQVILLCDQTKIGRNAFAQFASIEDIDIMITDKLQKEEIARLTEEGISVVEAEGIVT